MINFIFVNKLLVQRQYFKEKQAIITGLKKRYCRDARKFGSSRGRYRKISDVVRIVDNVETKNPKGGIQ